MQIYLLDINHTAFCESKLASENLKMIQLGPFSTSNGDYFYFKHIIAILATKPVTRFLVLLSIFTIDWQRCLHWDSRLSFPSTFVHKVILHHHHFRSHQFDSYTDVLSELRGVISIRHIVIIESNPITWYSETMVNLETLSTEREGHLKSGFFR